jgi:glycerophosphoryl diester phosphodiesterase
MGCRRRRFVRHCYPAHPHLRVLWHEYAKRRSCDFFSLSSRLHLVLWPSTHSRCSRGHPLRHLLAARSTLLQPDRAEIAAVLEERRRLARVTRWEDGEGLIIAHRGSSEKFPNRPLDAFQDAVGVGADAIEFDIRRTRDDLLVVYHDEEAAGVRLSDANYRELISRMPPHELPTLEEVLDAVAGQILVDAELKDSGIEELALSQLLASVDADALLVTSFHAPSVTKLKTLAANVQTGLIVERKDVSPTIETVLAERSRSGADFLVAHKDFVQMGLLDCAREAALPLYLWTVNNADELQTYLRDQHVAGVITDVPDVAIDIRAALDDENRGTDLVIM